MPYRTYNVSTRTLLQLTAIFIFVFFVGGVGAALAGGTTVTSLDKVPYNGAVPPLVVPDAVISIAGNTHSAAAGYAGDGQYAQGPIFAYPTANPSQVNGPYAVAVDSVGNVYIADTGNYIIREINAQTGSINTIAGIEPTGCIGPVCSTRTSGCADGVLARGTGIGTGIHGLAVDGYGNVYFSDSTSQSLSIIYKGGTRVAQFISLVNSAAAPTPASVVPGYLYHIAGTVNLTPGSCSGTKGSADNVLAFQNSALLNSAGANITGAEFNGPGQINLDSAGNIYIQDASNLYVRVINTQTTPQTFYQTVVQPGYLRAVALCGTNTVACPSSSNTFSANYPQTVNGVYQYEYPGLGQPASTAKFSPLSALGVDAWGNAYVANGSGASPNNAIGVAYTGGPLGHLLNFNLQTGIYTSTATAANYQTNQISPVPGDFYDVLNMIGAPTSTLPGFVDEVASNQSTTYEIRPSVMNADALGHIWYYDNHYPEIMRVDVNSGTVYGVIGSTSQRSITAAGSHSGNGSGYGTATSPPTAAAPMYCDFGTLASPFTSGPKTYDAYGDNCPAIMGSLGGDGFGLIVDGPGNVYFTDTGSSSGLTTISSQLVRELLLNTVFPMTAMTGYAASYPTQTGAPSAPIVTGPVTQAIQVHFDQWNWPYPLAGYSGAGATTTPVQYTTSAFSIAPVLVAPSTSTPDFSFDTTDSEFPMWFLIGGSGDAAATSSNNYIQAGAPTCVQSTTGLSTRVAGTFGTDPDFGIDCIVYVSFNPQAPGLREAQLMVTTQQMTPSKVKVSTAPTASGVFNTYYIPLSGTGYGAQLAIDGAQQSVVPVTGLGATGSNAVAVNSAGVVYATDPVNNRVVITPAAASGFTGSTTSGKTTVTVNTLGLGAGLTITGAGIPANTTIASVGTVAAGTQGTITLSAAATATASNVPLTVAVGPALPGLTTNLSGPLGVAVDGANNIYISDTGNNRILEMNPVTGAATQLGNYVWVPGTSTQNTVTGALTATTTTAPAQYAFKAPQGLAVDTVGNVYVADTGNQVVAEIPSNPAMGGAFALLQNTGVSNGTFTNPVAVAVDQRGNVYVADTGNVRGNIAIIPAGGGDFIGGDFAGNITSSVALAGTPLTTGTLLQFAGGTGIGSPNGVAVDAAGNVYISDSSDGSVWVQPSAQQFGKTQYVLNMPGLKTPAGLALDQNGNLYVADSGLGQVLYMNRSNPTASFGTVPQLLTSPSGLAGVGLTAQGGTTISSQCPVVGMGNPCTSNVLTIANIGNAPITPTSFYSISGNPAFAINASATTCKGTLNPGATCVIAPTFYPASDGSQSATLTINGGQTLALVGSTQGTGEQPLVNIALTTPTLTPAYGGAAVVTATVTQPHHPTNIALPANYVPSGTVSFTWSIDGATVSSPGICGTGGGTGTAAIGQTNNFASPTVVPLNSSGVATFTLPAATSGLNPGLQYTVYATYTPGDIYSSYTVAPTPLVINVTPNPVEAATAPSSTFTYGGVPPTLSGAGYSVSPALPTGSAVTFTTFNPSTNIIAPLTQCGNPAGQYNIIPVFSGPIVCNLGVWQNSTLKAYNSNGTTQATVTEAAVNPLSVSFLPSSMTAYYGAPTINFGTTPPLVIAGAVCNDLRLLSATFSTPGSSGVLNSQLLSVGTFAVVPALSGKPIDAGDYTVVPTNGSLAVLQAPTSLGVSAAKTSVLQSALSSATFGASVSTAVPGGIGTPTGTISISDTFVPITSNAPGTSATIPACSTFFTGTTTQGSATVSLVSSTYGLFAPYPLATSTTYEAVTALTSGASINPIAANTTLAAVGTGNLTLSSNATATASNVVLVATIPNAAPGTLTAAGTLTPASANCIQTNSMTLLAGGATYTPSSTALGNHYYGFAYNGDANFTPSATAASAIAMVIGGTCPAESCLTIDNADFVLTSTTGTVAVVPGVTPSGNGLPTASGQVTADPGSALIAINPILSETGVINLSCTTQNPSYVFCSMTPAYVTLTGTTAQYSILSVWTPATLPLGFFNTSHVKTSTTRTAWAFLPLGVLAFCVRRRRKLSKALWMLIAIAAVSVGMSGCGSNQVNLYTPVPQGPQTVTVTGAGTSITTLAPVTRSFNVGISIN